MIQYASARTPFDAQRIVAVETIFSDIEIERREIDRAKIMKGLEQFVELVVLNRTPNLKVQLPQAMQHPAFELRHLIDANALTLLEAVKVAAG